jgi:hypothetical protein
MTFLFRISKEVDFDRSSIRNSAIPTDRSGKDGKMSRTPQNHHQRRNYSKHQSYFEEIDKGLRFHDVFSVDLEIFIDKHPTTQWD